jgi:ribosomal protein L7/L12
MTIIVTDNGTIHRDVPIEKLTVIYERQYAVIMFWNPEQKIKAIKAIRAITHMDLKSSKEYVESHPVLIKVKNKLTYEEAEEIRRILTHDENMECEIRKEL